MNTSLKWLVLASFTNLVGNSLGTVVAFQQNLPADWGGWLDLHGPVLHVGPGRRADPVAAIEPGWV